MACLHNMWACHIPICSQRFPSNPHDMYHMRLPRAKHADPRFPVGKARLEAVGVILCACLMTLSSFEVIRSSGEDLWGGVVKGRF